ncbi:MAG: AAA family ATPase [Anaerolineae bacterium]
MATLWLTCGPPGSGKTTIARRIEEERGAVRMTADEWLLRLWPEDPLGSHRSAIEPLQWELTARLLRLGVNVVLDWGIWAREERDTLRLAGRALGARVVLLYESVELVELQRRVTARAAGAEHGVFAITSWMWAELERNWQPPDAAELGLFDAPEGLAQTEPGVPVDRPCSARVDSRLWIRV